MHGLRSLVDADLPEVDRPSPAVFSLAVPSLASPGAMLAIALLTANHRASLADQTTVAAVVITLCCG